MSEPDDLNKWVAMDPSEVMCPSCRSGIYLFHRDDGWWMCGDCGEEWDGEPRRNSDGKEA